MNKRALFKTLLIITVVGASFRIALADCDYLKKGAHCGDYDQKPRIGKQAPGNNCTEVKYSINADATRCTAISEEDCGYDACTQNTVKIVQIINVWTCDYNAVDCVLPIIGHSMQDLGTCDQDSIPDSANECGNCP